MFAYKSKQWSEKYSKEEWKEATRAEAERAQNELKSAIKEAL